MHVWSRRRAKLASWSHYNWEIRSCLILHHSLFFFEAFTGRSALGGGIHGISSPRRTDGRENGASVGSSKGRLLVFFPIPFSISQRRLLASLAGWRIGGVRFVETSSFVDDSSQEMQASCFFFSQGGRRSLLGLFFSLPENNQICGGLAASAWIYPPFLLL
ncbi:hypothetical protein IWZ00DRAFT_95941 [Phyllosticta capitalensis]